MIFTIVAFVVVVVALGLLGYARAHSDRNSKAQNAKAREAYARDIEADR